MERIRHDVARGSRKAQAVDDEVLAYLSAGDEADLRRLGVDESGKRRLDLVGGTTVLLAPPRAIESPIEVLRGRAVRREADGMHRGVVEVRLGPGNRKLIANRIEIHRLSAGQPPLIRGVFHSSSSAPPTGT